ncbi:HetP family heterocyst commitment protein [Leptothoe sp. PORK10 BA2]|uniref:HetP family heterocyst commitment protein n=1 Tax=Leptothoe sp. PORK10 BA2 TaxID=3110254 RepID=UPI002B2048AE|nr:HetP family heterocyst commitment protein [Leptothoe sp. PORK10 BA2]MEA5466584.1 HetP family heterocyst commitment protein [Leptothoe sp. PORK10 BA2]
MMHQEKFDEVIEAILDGKYSWACVLFLSIAGHNPLQYIPYRTYHRLMQVHHQSENGLKRISRHHQAAPAAHPQHTHRAESRRRILDLNYLEAVDTTQARLRGGWRKWLSQTPSTFLADPIYARSISI